MLTDSRKLQRLQSMTTPIRNQLSSITVYWRKGKYLKAVIYTIIIDKITLLNNMHDLDDKRTKTLSNCYSVVKQNLGKIFNDLLPGATAHLNLMD